MQMGVAIIYVISYIRVHTWKLVWCCTFRLKSLLKLNNFRKPRLIFQEWTDCTLLRSSTYENDSSYNPLPSELIHQFPIHFHWSISLQWISFTFNNLVPFGHIVRPYQFFHCSTPTICSSSWNTISIWSPLILGLDNSLIKMTHIKLFIAYAKEGLLITLYLGRIL